MAEHNELGIEGENIAVKYLCKNGFRILKRNYRLKHAEVDIIALKDACIHVVEVKTRQSHYLAGPEITVTRKKQKAIVKVANAYIEESGFDGETQFDIISIVMNSNELTVQYLEDAFYPII